MFGPAASGAAGSGIGQFKKKKKHLSTLSKKVHALSTASSGAHMSPIPGSQDNVSAFMTLDELAMDLLFKKDLLKKEFSAMMPFRYELLPETPAECLYRLPVAMVPPSDYIKEKQQAAAAGSTEPGILHFETEDEKQWIEREKAKLVFPIIENDESFDFLPTLSSMVEPLASPSMMPNTISIQPMLSPALPSNPSSSLASSNISSNNALSTKLSIGKKKIKLVSHAKK